MERSETNAGGENITISTGSTARVLERNPPLRIKTIECPVDIQHFTVDIDAKTFYCPIHNGELVIENLV